MPSVYEEIAKKAQVIDKGSIMDVVFLFENIYKDPPNEAILERFLGMMGMSCGLKNYDELLKEYCPNSVKLTTYYQKTAQKFTGYIERLIRKAV